jgi:hypothetical protein
VRFTLYWSLDNTARITTVEDLDIALTLVARSRRRARGPYVVDLLPAGTREGGLQLGIGHPERAFVLDLHPSGGYATESGVPAWPEPIAFDCGREVVEFKPEWTRVTARAAIEAARRYVHTGARPRNLRFTQIAVADRVRD